MTSKLRNICIFIFFCLTFSACVHTTKRYEVDECYLLVREAALARMKCPAYVMDYMILDQETSFSCIDEFVDNLPAGEKVLVSSVIYQGLGATGACWRVFATLQDKPEFGDVEIPACIPGLKHPKGWAIVDDGVVQLNPERFRKCSNQ